DEQRRAQRAELAGGVPLFHAAPSSGAVVADQREHLVAVETGAALQERELDHERAADHPAAAARDELHRGRGGASRREQVVDDEHAVTVADGVVVDLERVRAVLELKIGRASCRERVEISVVAAVVKRKKSTE